MSPSDDHYFGLPKTLDRVCGQTGNLTLAIAYEDKEHIFTGSAKDAPKIMRDALIEVCRRSTGGVMAGTLTSGIDFRPGLERACQSVRANGRDCVTADSADLLALMICLNDTVRYDAYQRAQFTIHRSRFSPLARWLALVSVRSLPHLDRGRYIAEYAGEMSELPPRGQVAYALNALLHTWVLRRVLLTEARARRRRQALR